MDISVIKAQEVGSEFGIHIGQSDKKVLELINLRCPYCRKWFFESKDILDEAVSNGQAERVIKLVDKTKESLQRGNVMHRFVDTSNPQKALEEIELIFNHQDEWGNLSLDDVEKYAQEKLGLAEHDHKKYAKELSDEADRANVKFVPTIIIGQTIFDESISQNELKDLLA
ncbi:thioredoxin [Floricoccus tropicus]|uniref:Thioredoxin n=1 Tax=Floricoccus tropicus TaxID=1859473 RepID=A0A1E8GRD9_9LACT|nr:thioredoxin domain-containing protein [Floricoccus tropicus]OFI50058.1 thioredoxin [Floricoccus tropicus]